MTTITSLDDLQLLFRPLKQGESAKAQALLPVVEDSIRQQAKNLGKDIDEMIAAGELLKGVFVSVVCDVTGRALMTSTDSEPVSQFSQAGLGYSVSGTYLVPGGGLFIKKSELARLGLRRQRIGGIELYA